MQAEDDSKHRLSRSDIRRKSFRHNFSHMISLQTSEGLQTKNSRTVGETNLHNFAVTPAKSPKV